MSLKNNCENKNPLIGFHVSIRGSIDLSVERAVKLGCTVFQLFTTNPRSWKPRILTDLEVEKFNEKRMKNNFQIIFTHMPYLPNLASPKTTVYYLSVKTLLDEIARCTKLNIPYIVTHLGSHLGDGYTKGVKRIIEALNQAINLSKGKVKIILENTAGAVNSIGSKFEHIKDIIDGIQDSDNIGFCFDTCHGWAAGYDIKTVNGINETIEKLDKIIGLKKVYLIHLNDSIGGLGSHIDRHEHIGLGTIGIEGFKNLLRSCLGRLPLVMETPIDERRRDQENMIIVKKLISEL